MKFRQLFWIAGGLLAVIALAHGPIVPVAGAQASEGQRLLQQLIEGARKEGQLTYYGVSSMRGRGVKELMQAFNKRFELNTRLTADFAGSSATFAKAVMESKTGLSPTFDVMYGNGHRLVRLWQNGGVDRIDKWELLLKEISAEAYKVRDKVSPLKLAGYLFLWSHRIGANIYNTNLISEAELPKTRVELGDPKYKGTFALPPWTTVAQYGVLQHSKERWLEIVRSWSAQDPMIMKYTGGIKRMLLGEFKFMPANAKYVYEHKARDPKSPIGLAFFKDLTTASWVFHSVRKGAKNPNTARLFTLWATTLEANRTFENVGYGGTPNIVLGQGPLSRPVLKALKERNIKPVSWWDSEKNLETLFWYSTKAGKKYAKKLGKAQTGRK